MSRPGFYNKSIIQPYKEPAQRGNKRKNDHPVFIDDHGFSERTKAGKTHCADHHDSIMKQHRDIASQNANTYSNKKEGDVLIKIELNKYIIEGQAEELLRRTFEVPAFS